MLRCQKRDTHGNRGLTGSVFVPVLRLGHLWDRDPGVIAERSEQARSGERRRLHDVKRRKTTQSPTSLRLRPTGETTPHALQQYELTVLLSTTSAQREDTSL